MTRHMLLIAESRTPIDMDFAAGPAGAGFGHFPEIVFASKRKHVGGVNAGLPAPSFYGLIVGRNIAFIVLKIRGPQTSRIQSPNAR